MQVKPKKKIPREADITRNVRKLLNYHGIFHSKIWQGMMSAKGISDIIGCYKGRYFAIEVKRPGGKPTSFQEKFLENVKRAGGIAIVARSVDDVIRGLGLEEKMMFGERRI